MYNTAVIRIKAYQLKKNLPFFDKKIIFNDIPSNDKFLQQVFRIRTNFLGNTIDRLPEQQGKDASFIS